LAVMLAVVAVDETIPPRIDESMIEEFLPTNFERIYHRYETPDITTTKNQIEYGLKKSNVTRGWDISTFPAVKNENISTSENL